MSVEKAVKAGAVFYSIPSELDYSKVDPLLRGIVKKINESGWVWTAESCQGHPESDRQRAWAGNTRPFLRLVCKSSHTGEMFNRLLKAMRYSDEGLEQSLCFHVYPWFKSMGEYEQVLIYIEATCVYERNLGIAAYERFAESLTPLPDK